MTLLFILVFSVARSNSFFLHCFPHQCSYFFSLTWAMVGHSLALLLSVLHHCLQFGLTNVSDQVRADTASVWGRDTAQYVLREWGELPYAAYDTSETLPLALIGCVDPGAVDSCKWNYSHWVEPQIVDFYTADLILLSDHNDNFSKYNKKIVTDYNINRHFFLVLAIHFAPLAAS